MRCVTDEKRKEKKKKKEVLPLNNSFHFNSEHRINLSQTHYKNK